MRVLVCLDIHDDMFPADCRAERRAVSVPFALRLLEPSEGNQVLNCCHEGQRQVLEAVERTYRGTCLTAGLPEAPPKVRVRAGDAILMITVTGLPPLNDLRKHYTAAQAHAATFRFGLWKLLPPDDKALLATLSKAQASADVIGAALSSRLEARDWAPGG